MNREDQEIENEFNLPFSVFSMDGRPVDERIEAATIFWLAERQIKRKMFYGQQEKIDWIVKSHYSLVISPFNHKWILIDPLGLFSITVKRIILPKIDEFIQHLHNSHSDRELFKNMLVRHQHIFDRSMETESRKIIGIPNREVTNSIIECMEKIESCSPSIHSLLEFPRIKSRESINNILSELNSINEKINEDLRDLEDAQQILDEEMQFHLKKIEEEIIGIESEYKEQKEATLAITSKSIEQSTAKRELEIGMVMSRFEEQKRFFNNQQSEYRRISTLLKKDNDVLENMIENSKNTDGKYLEIWKKIVRENKKLIEDINRKITDLQSVIQTIEENRSREISSIENAYSQLFSPETRMINEVDVESGLEVQTRREEVKVISESANIIKTQILQIKKGFKECQNQVECLLIEMFKEGKSTFLNIPFYLICYQNHAGMKRYSSFSPSFFQTSISTGFSLKRSAFSIQPLKPYCEELNKIITENLIDRLMTDSILEGELYVKAQEKNILKSTFYTEIIKEGLDILNQQGWLNNKDSIYLKSELVK